MSYLVSRRQLAALASCTMPVAADVFRTTASTPPLGELFPTQPPEWVREMVTVSHFDLRRVQQLVHARPSLVRATWDWGFGDWENPLGAASHMGNRAIAEFLLENGAAPSIFSAAMLGQLELVKAFVGCQPGVQQLPGPHSISLLAHAKAGGEAALPVYQVLQALGNAQGEPTLPLSDREQASILGRYPFGAAPTEEVAVQMENGHLTWTRKGTMGRWLFHLGNCVFHPAGAPAVRIRFRQEHDGMRMTVSDPDVVLSALRNDKA